MSHKPELVEAVIFDFDGTLTAPGSLDFAGIRAAIGCPERLPVLEWIESIPSAADKEKAWGILERSEMEAALKSQPNAGAEDVIDYLRGQGIKLGIISRNSLRAIHRALENFTRIGARDFSVILSRDDLVKPKPSPDAVLKAAERMGVPVGQTLVVGDYVFDVEAGRKAGARTVFLTNQAPTPVLEPPPEHIIEQLTELKGIVRFLSPLPPGKLPNDYLHQFIAELGLADPSLLIAPGVGEDVAAVESSGDEILVFKSDPVTLASDAIASYAVIVSMNDVATSGATPRWLLASLLFPPGTSPAQVREVFCDLRDVSRRHGLILCGGHTEITDAVTRSIIVGQVVGTVRRKELIEKRNMKAGDCVLLTKGVAVEGTCIIAREFSGRLEALGVTADEISKCRRFLTDPGISIVEEARMAVCSGGVTAMHDVTEGGLATAVAELSAAGGHKLRVYLDRIPVLPETRKLCRLLELDPLGLIGSGSLLIACDRSACDRLVRSIRQAKIEAVCIGEVLEPGVGVEAMNEAQGAIVPWPRFEVDEITRLWGRAR